MTRLLIIGRMSDYTELTSEVKARTTKKTNRQIAIITNLFESNQRPSARTLARKIDKEPSTNSGTKKQLRIGMEEQNIKYWCIYN